MSSTDLPSVNSFLITVFKKLSMAVLPIGQTDAASYIASGESFSLGRSFTEPFVKTYKNESGVFNSVAVKFKGFDFCVFFQVPVNLSAIDVSVKYSASS